MKIKLAILEKDQGYLNRISTVFSTKYADKIELYSFTDADVALSVLDTARIDVLLVSETFDINANAIPKRCGVAYFVDAPDVDSIGEHRAICKFQKVDLIYKQILSIYSENAVNVSGLKFGDDDCKVIVFLPVSGGVGSSSMAAACATYFASKGKKTLYLNFERFCGSDVFFEADGQFDMSDIIFALKSKKTNIAMKLESCVKQASNGVFFYSQSKIALDMLELNTEDIQRLVSEIQFAGSYDYVVVDAELSFNKDWLNIYRKAHTIVWVGDGSEISNTKLFRAYNALNTLEQKAEAPLTNRLALIYNKFSNKTSTTLSEIGIKNIGGAPRYEHASTEQVVKQLAAMEMFEKLM